MDARLGPYRLLSELGRAGMAETFVAERTGPAGFVQRVCLERILPAQSTDPAWIGAFQSEARVLATLQHPNIVAMHDFGHEGDTWWMALELVDGADLVRRDARATYRVSFAERFACGTLATG